MKTHPGRFLLADTVLVVIDTIAGVVVSCLIVFDFVLEPELELELEVEVELEFVRVCIRIRIRTRIRIRIRFEFVLESKKILGMRSYRQPLCLGKVESMTCYHSKNK